MKKLVNASAEKALTLRKRVKKNKPNFVRQESWRYVRLKENWRRPKGLDNKMRRKIKGWPPTVNTGYRGPKIVRGLHPSGYEEVLIHNTKDLKDIDPKTQAVRIAHTVGKRKRTAILLEAKKRKITILNLKEAKEVVKKEEAIEEEEEKGRRGSSIRSGREREETKRRTRKQW